jgi:hypothetical protein
VQQHGQLPTAKCSWDRGSGSATGCKSHRQMQQKQLQRFCGQQHPATHRGATSNYNGSAILRHYQADVMSNKCCGTSCFAIVGIVNNQPPTTHAAVPQTQATSGDRYTRSPTQ